MMVHAAMTLVDIGIFERLPDDVLIMIVAQMYERQEEDVLWWQARKDLRRRSRVDVRWRPSVQRCTWDELTNTEVTYAMLLGFSGTSESWDCGECPPVFLQPWCTLSPREFLAAWSLGYSPHKLGLGASKIHVPC